MKRVEARKVRERALIPAIVQGVASVGLLYPPEFTPTRYSHPHGNDLEVIGADMRRAFEKYRHEQKSDTSQRP